MNNPVSLEDTEKQIAPQVSKVRNRITHAAVWLTSAIQFALFKLPKKGVKLSRYCSPRRVYLIYEYFLHT